MLQNYIILSPCINAFYGVYKPYKGILEIENQAPKYQKTMLIKLIRLPNFYENNRRTFAY